MSMLWETVLHNPNNNNHMPLYNLLVREFKCPNHKYYADGETDIHREGERERESILAFYIPATTNSLNRVTTIVTSSPPFLFNQFTDQNVIPIS